MYIRHHISLSADRICFHVLALLKLCLHRSYCRGPGVSRPSVVLPSVTVTGEGGGGGAVYYILAICQLLKCWDTNFVKTGSYGPATLISKSAAPTVRSQLNFVRTLFTVTFLGTVPKFKKINGTMPC